MRRAILIGLFLLGLIAAAGSAQAATTYVGTSNEFGCSSSDLLQDPGAGAVWSGTLSGTYFQPWGGTEPLLHDGSATPVGTAVWASIANPQQGVPIGSTWTYTLNTSVNTGGYNLSQVNLFFGNGEDNGHSGMAVKVEYSKVGSGTFDVLYDMGYNQFDSTGYGKISIGDYNYVNGIPTTATFATIATGVDAVRFSWASEHLPLVGAPTPGFGPGPTKTSLQNDGTPVYEIDVLGTASVISRTVVGTPVPAPAGLALLGLGSMGLAFILMKDAEEKA